MDAPAHSAPILKLPDEILLNTAHQLITGLAKRNLEYNLAHLCKAPGREVDANEFTHAKLARLALVSRRFHRVATALLLPITDVSIFSSPTQWPKDRWGRGGILGQRQAAAHSQSIPGARGEPVAPGLL